MRFDLVDNILERTDDRIVTVKNVTAAEEYLGDHFPSFPILPGVMMLEALVQAARRLIGDAGGPWVVAEVRNVKYGNMVRPGQQLRVEVERMPDKEPPARPDAGEHRFNARGTVEGEVAVAGRFTLRKARR